MHTACPPELEFNSGLDKCKDQLEKQYSDTMAGHLHLIVIIIITIIIIDDKNKFIFFKPFIMFKTNFVVCFFRKDLKTSFLFFYLLKSNYKLKNRKNNYKIEHYCPLFSLKTL